MVAFANKFKDHLLKRNTTLFFETQKGKMWTVDKTLKNPVILMLSTYNETHIV